MTPFDSIMIPFDLIMTPFNSIMTPFDSILTPFDSILTLFMIRYIVPLHIQDILLERLTKHNLDAPFTLFLMKETQTLNNSLIQITTDLQVYINTQ